MSILFKKISEILKNSAIEDCNLEAEIIIRHFSGFSQSEVMFRDESEYSPEMLISIEKAVEERISGRPVQYIIGQWDFFESTFAVGEGVLIPRPETELLCEYVIGAADKSKECVIYDLCSGSGCIGISVKKALPEAEVVLVEKSEKAFEYLRKNSAAILKETDITMINGDIFDFSFFANYPNADIIVSNPPYIRKDEIPKLQREVQREPSMALDGGEDGLDFYRFIISVWSRKLKSGGIIAFECGEEQADDISAIFIENGFDAEIRKDYNHINRFVIGRKQTCNSSKI